MKVIRTANRRKKIDPHNGPADAGNALLVRAVNGESNGRINTPQSLSGFDDFVLGSSTGQSTASAAVLEKLYRALGQVTAVTHPRTFKLLQSGDRKLARKVIEGACEVAGEAVAHHAPGFPIARRQAPRAAHRRSRAEQQSRKCRKLLLAGSLHAARAFARSYRASVRVPHTTLLKFNLSILEQCCLPGPLSTLIQKLGRP